MDLYIDKAHTALDIFRFAAFFFIDDITPFPILLCDAFKSLKKRIFISDIILHNIILVHQRVSGCHLSRVHLSGCCLSV